jgi:colanic acid biosynthesis glycosyl transferase WcaI
VRALFVTHFYPPEELSAAFLAAEFAAALVEHGHQVDVLTGFPNWPAGQAFPGYSARRFATETVSGVNVHRVPFMASPNGNFISRALDFKSFQLSAWHYGRRLPRPDLVYVLVPPNEDALVAARLARHFGSIFVPNIQDVQPDTAIALGYLRNKLLISLLRRQEAAVYRDAGRIVAIGESMKQRLMQKGIAAERIEVLPNWINPRDIVPLPRCNPLRTEWGISADRFVVLYAGTFGRIHNVPILLEAARQLRQTQALLLLVGQGYDFETVRSAAASGEYPNVLVKPFVPRSRLSELQSLSDVSVVLVRGGYAHTSVPSKVLGYMSAGRQVIGSLDADSDSAALIRDAGCGELVAPDDATSIAQAVTRAMSDRALGSIRGANARRFVEERMSGPVVLARGVAMLEDIVARSS